MARLAIGNDGYVPFSWVRPVDPRVLEGRPLLDVGVGDGQTLRTLIERRGLVVGTDRSADALRAARDVGVPLVRAEGAALPFRDGSFEAVLAGDLFHHLDDSALNVVLREVRRVLAVGGRLVAWWYAKPGRPSPDAPRFPRSAPDVERTASAAGYEPSRLELVTELVQSPRTEGLELRRR